MRNSDALRIIAVFLPKYQNYYVHFKNNEEELLKNMQNDVKWLKESVMPEFLSDLTNDQLDMLITTCKVWKNIWWYLFFSLGLIHMVLGTKKIYAVRKMLSFLFKK